MAHLNHEHINFIIKDLNRRGIILEGFQEEVIDHVCAAVESEMDNGKRFADAYLEVLKAFGKTSGLQEAQRQTLLSENQKARNMIRNYLIIAWRSLSRQSFYSAINIAGLAVGIAACLIIVLFINEELTYDKYNTKADRIYRVHAEIIFGGNHFKMLYRSAPEANALLQDYPEIESVVRFRSGGSYLIKTEDTGRNVKERNVQWADSTFFRIFSVPVLEGNPSTALAEPGGVALSKKMADKYFPGTSPLGKMLILDNNYHMKVTAVFEDMPAASHFHFDIIVAMLGDFPIAKESRRTSFVSENFAEYILLKEGTHAKALEQKFPDFLQKYMGPELTQALGKEFSMKKFEESGQMYHLTLMPLTDIHLHSDVRGELEPNGNITYVYLFATIAAFILIIASINFMNLSTARSSVRAKEVGVRKVMGSLRSHLIRQFLTESLLVTLFALIVAIGIAYLFLPVFNNLSTKQLFIPFGTPRFYLLMAGALVVIGTLAGLYPAFFLSAFKPVSVLKGQMVTGGKSKWIRSSLVVFQFVISIFLIIGATTVNRQLNFIQNKKLGFEKDQVIVVHDAYALRPNNVQAFKTEALKLNYIEDGTVSGYVPVEVDDYWRNNSAYWRTDLQPTAENMVGFQNWGVDYDYVNTFKLKVKEGRPFSPDFPSDSSAVIINETAVTRFGLGLDPIGKKISTFREDGPQLDFTKSISWTVVGVVEDFHFSSMKEGIGALGLFLNKHSDGSESFRFAPQKTTDVIKGLEEIWNKLAPGQPFQYSFLDEDFERTYRSEQRLGEIFGIFAGLAILIACLGLFALTAYTAEQRTKEIGIRKVLGASVSSIVILLSKDFGKLILIAFVFSAPLAWFAVDWWLKSYTYKTEIGVIVYILAGLSAFAIALLTMGYQSIQAANLDPVKSMRSE